LKESLRGTKILLCGCGLKWFSPLRGTNSKTTHYLLSYFFWLNTLKGTAKASAVHLLRLNNPRGTKTVFLNPKRYEEHPCLFLYGTLSSQSGHPVKIKSTDCSIAFTP